MNKKLRKKLDSIKFSKTEHPYATMDRNMETIMEVLNELLEPKRKEIIRKQLEKNQ